MSHIGIDLGTTTTLLATAGSLRNGLVEPKLTDFKENGLVTQALRSVAYIPPKPADPAWYVGHDAVNLRAEHPEYFVRGVKRLMGRDVLLPSVNWTPRDVSSLYLQKIIDIAVKNAGFAPGDQITVTVPASFTAPQRADTLGALRDATKHFRSHLNDEILQNALISEPTAALLAIVNEDLGKIATQRTFAIDDNPVVLVYDIGGGTLDLTLVRLSWKDKNRPKDILNITFETLELTRYNQFGGEDFDLAVAPQIMAKYLEQFPELSEKYVSQTEIDKFRLTMLEDAEKLKTELQAEIDWSGDSAVITFKTTPIIVDNLERRVLNWNISVDDYLAWTAPLFTASLESKNLISPIEALLRSASIERRDVSYFIAIGGMTRFDPVNKRLRTYWNDEDRYLRPLNPDSYVALGAAVYSALKAHSPGYVINEPTADVYYIKTQPGYAVLYDHRETENAGYHARTTTQSRLLQLHVFTGDRLLNGSTLDAIYHTLVPQGSLIIDMMTEQPKDTEVHVRLLFREGDTSKVPFVEVALGATNQIISTAQLVLTQEI
jgi:molecular chaperone DnaK (HSP70)